MEFVCTNVETSKVTFFTIGFLKTEIRGICFGMYGLL